MSSESSSSPPSGSSLDRHRTLARALAFFVATSVALGSALAFTLLRPPGAATPVARQELQDGELRGEVVERLVRESRGIFDSHPDPDLGHVLLPGLADVEFSDGLVDTNAIGMPERAYALPKTAGRTRVVLLGDSYVFGMGVRPEERLGVFLEQALGERATRGNVECLHLGTPSWDVIAESQYVRRQLSLLQPDLVVQISINNDLNDSLGVRGFGALATFAPRVRGRADATTRIGAPGFALGTSATNYLNDGLDWESQRRFEQAGAALGRLAREVERAGGRYLLVSAWGGRAAKLFGPLQRAYRLGHVGFLPHSFMNDREFHVSDTDGHWNQAGHERVAKLIYGLILERELLPDLGLAPWPEATAEVAALHERGRAEAEALAELELPPGRAEPSARIDFVADAPRALAHVHAGIDAEGFVAPYACVLLAGSSAGSPGQRLALRGLALARPEMDGARVEVFVDADSVGEFELLAGSELDLSWELPAAERRYRSVRLVADDWIYSGPRLRRCVSFQIHSLAIE